VPEPGSLKAEHELAPSDEPTRLTWIAARMARPGGQRQQAFAEAKSTLKLGPIGACPENGGSFHFQHNSDKCLILAGFLRLSQSEKIAGHQDHTSSPSALHRSSLDTRAATASRAPRS